MRHFTETIKTYLRTDRNQTKYFLIQEPCLKCGGHGYIDYYQHHDKGICYDCDGRGYIEYTEKEYTEEYAKKMEARRQARAEKKSKERRAKADDLNRQWYTKKFGCQENGLCYIILGKQDKAQMKELGCRWKPLLGWISAEDLEGFDTIEVDMSRLVRKDSDGIIQDWEYDNDYYTEIHNQVEEFYHPKNTKADWVHPVGQRLELAVKLTKTAFYEYESFRGYGMDTMFIYIFEDAEKNVYVWKTTGLLDMKPNEEHSIKATIKAHEEYKDVKQHIISRVKVVA